MFSDPVLMENVISEICVTHQDDAECVYLVCFRKKTKIISVLRGMRSRQCLKIVYRRQSKLFVKRKCILAFGSNLCNKIHHLSEM